MECRPKEDEGEAEVGLRATDVAPGEGEGECGGGGGTYVSRPYAWHVASKAAAQSGKPSACNTCRGTGEETA